MAREAGGDDGGATRYASGADQASPIPDWIAASYPGTEHSAAWLSGGVALFPGGTTSGGEAGEPNRMTERVRLD